MPRTTAPIFLAILLGLAAPVAAQEAPEGEQTTADPAPAEAPAADPADAAPAADPADALSMGEPAAEGEARTGQPYIREEYGDWALRCIRAPEDQPDPCQLYQLLMDEDGNAVAEISVFPLPESQRAAAGATIVAPLETLLTEDLVLTVDGAAARRYPFTFCNRAGCVARVGFTEEEVQQFKRGASAQLRMVPAAAPDQEVVLDVSLSGFTAGYEANTDIGEE